MPPMSNRAEGRHLAKFEKNLRNRIYLRPKLGWLKSAGKSNSFENVRNRTWCQVLGSSFCFNHPMAKS